MPLLFPAPSVFPAKSKPYPCKPNLHHQRRPLHLSPRRHVVLPPPASGEVDAFTQYSGYLFEKGSSSAEADLPKEYDPEAIAAIYRRKPVLVARRLAQIGTSIGRWFVLRYVDRALDRSDVMFKVRAAELRMIFLRLGPAFVKIAQAVSSRADVIPPAYLEELSLLQLVLCHVNS